MKETKAEASVIGRTGPVPTEVCPVLTAICFKTPRTRMMERIQMTAMAAFAAFPSVGGLAGLVLLLPRRKKAAPTARRTSARKTAASPE